MEEEDAEVHHMDEIIPNLWIGDYHSAIDSESLRKHNIFSVLSAMRGRVVIKSPMLHFQVQLDDTEDSDALALFPQCIAIIEKELDKGRGVLVHCHAGMSRSATVVAAYLMYAQNLDASAALQLIAEKRPCTQPNDGFLAQLDVFYQASYNVTRRSKATRMYYLERALDEIMNGDGTIPDDNMFAKYPRTPSDSAPATPGGPRRRIRCKMCRQELATREHMLDHGQVGPSTPASIASPTNSSPVSRRPSTNSKSSNVLSDTASVSSRQLLLSSLSLTKSTPSSTSLVSRRASSGSSGSSLSPLASTPDGSALVRRLSSNAGRSDLQPLTPRSPLSASASNSSSGLPASTSSSTKPRRPSFLSSEITNPVARSISETLTAAENVENMSALDTDDENEGEADEKPTSHRNGTGNSAHNGAVVRSPTSEFSSPADLAAQLNANPKLAALRSLSIASSSPTLSNAVGSAQNILQTAKATQALKSPPLLVNNACSGYFVEPMKWMEPFLQNGELAGKILCPNKKCGAKLGNYDWAGARCSCKEWVTPGFCIHRSKVDEIV